MAYADNGNGSVPVTVDLGVDLSIERWIIISMMVLCNDIVTIEHDRRTPGLADEPVVMEHGNNRTEE